MGSASRSSGSARRLGCLGDQVRSVNEPRGSDALRRQRHNGFPPDRSGVEDVKHGRGGQERTPGHAGVDRAGNPPADDDRLLTEKEGRVASARSAEPRITFFHQLDGGRTLSPGSGGGEAVPNRPTVREGSSEQSFPNRGPAELEAAAPGERSPERLGADDSLLGGQTDSSDRDSAHHGHDVELRAGDVDAGKLSGDLDRHPVSVDLARRRGLVGGVRVVETLQRPVSTVPQFLQEYRPPHPRVDVPP